MILRSWADYNGNHTKCLFKLPLFRGHTTPSNYACLANDGRLYQSFSIAGKVIQSIHLHHGELFALILSECED